MGTLLFIVLATIVAIACHRWIRPFLLASLISGPVAACAFQGIVTIQLGHPDPFAIIALFTTTLVGWIVAVLVGVVMKFVSLGAAAEPEAGGATEEQRQRVPAGDQPDERSS